MNMGSNLSESSGLFFNKVLFYAIVHIYLQQPGIIKLFLL
jgi:hypothetical protein